MDLKFGLQLQNSPNCHNNAMFVPYRCTLCLIHRYQRFPAGNMPNRFNYPIREADNQNQMRPFNNIASVYETVAAKVGVG